MDSLYQLLLHIDYLEDEGQRQRVINNKTHIFIERFLGVISYCAGIKLRAVNKVTMIIIGPNFKATIHPVSKSESPKIKFSIPTELVNGTVLSDEIYAALFWLRRGLAESDPINVFNPLMICLQILARNWFKKKNPQSQIPSITSLFKDYTITECGADPSIVDEVWKKKRNAIVAHGNKLIIDADDFIRLTELKFEVAVWAYRGINRALGLDLEKAPRPSQNFFVTDTIMNLD